MSGLTTQEAAAEQEILTQVANGDYLEDEIAVYIAALLYVDYQPHIARIRAARRAARPESFYRDELARSVNGRTEVKLAFGRADVIAKPGVFEVEPFSTWRTGVRQALHYGAMSGLTANVAIYGFPDREAQLKTFLKIRDSGISVTLWARRSGGSWVPVTSREAALRKYS